MAIGLRISSLPKEITEMTEADQPQVRDIGREEDVVRRVEFLRVLEDSAERVTRRMSVLLIVAVTKLGMNGAEYLGRSGMIDRDCEARPVVNILINPSN